MITNIVDQVYQLKVPIPYDTGEINCYLIKGEKGFTIVDTGAYTKQAIALWKRTLSRNMPVEKVVFTHLHPDHVGLAGWFQQQFNVPVWISANGYEELLKTRALFIGEQYLNPLTSFFHLHGSPALPKRDEQYHQFETYQFEPNKVFEENQAIKLGDCMYEAIWTPGHSPDHFCFYDRRNQIMIVGDHILDSINPIVLSQKRGDNALKDYLQSLDKVVECPAKLVLTGHGKLITDLSRRVEEMKSHYQKRWKQTYDSIREEGSTAYEVAQRVYSRELPLDRSIAAFMQTITNLVYLESIGYIRMEEQDEKVIFHK
jgi:glyoxylase-like metal-dependent hydrolase (beta-lactamase superfamily II)